MITQRFFARESDPEIQDLFNKLRDANIEFGIQMIFDEVGFELTIRIPKGKGMKVKTNLIYKFLNR